MYILERIYFIDGLDCANCAAKLERHLCEVPYFDQVVIDFMAKKMIVTVKDEASLQNGMVLADILIKQMEPGVVVSEKEIAGKKRRPPAEAHHHAAAGIIIRIMNIIMEKRVTAHIPIIIRIRTENRAAAVTVITLVMKRKSGQLCKKSRITADSPEK